MTIHVRLDSRRAQECLSFAETCWIAEIAQKKLEVIEQVGGAIQRAGDEDVGAGVGGGINRGTREV